MDNIMKKNLVNDRLLFGVFSSLVCMRYHCTLHQTLYAWLMRGVWYWCGLESLIIGSHNFLKSCLAKHISKNREWDDPKVYGENVQKKLQSIINSIGEQSTLLLMAVGDCIVNKKSQAEITTKYSIPRSRIQWAMLGKKEHKKGGKQYQQERKRKTSEEDSTRSLKSRRNERELERIDDKPTPDIEGQNSKDDSDELPDVQL